MESRRAGGSVTTAYSVGLTVISTTTEPTLSDRSRELCSSLIDRNSLPRDDATNTAEAPMAMGWELSMRAMRDPLTASGSSSVQLWEGITSAHMYRAGSPGASWGGTCPGQNDHLPYRYSISTTSRRFSTNPVSCQPSAARTEKATGGNGVLLRSVFSVGDPVALQARPKATQIDSAATTRNLRGLRLRCITTPHARRKPLQGRAVAHYSAEGGSSQPTPIPGSNGQQALRSPCRVGGRYSRSACW